MRENINVNYTKKKLRKMLFLSIYSNVCKIKALFSEIALIFQIRYVMRFYNVFLFVVFERECDSASNCMSFYKEILTFPSSKIKEGLTLSFDREKY